MDDLSTWLLAQIEADEELARKATPGPWTVERSGSSGGAWVEPNVAGYIDVEMSYGEALGTLLNAENADHIAAWDPAHVLAECEAKRRIIELGRSTIETHKLCDRCEYGALYAKLGRPGYQENWRPA
jgi:hypothetical protein